MNRREFIDLVTMLCLVHRGSMTSYVRTIARNAIVGGHEHSKHLVGLAVDVVLDRKEDQGEFTLAAQRLGLRVIDEDDHLHVQVP